MRGGCFAARREGRANLRALLLDRRNASSSCAQLGQSKRDERQPVRMMIAPRAERVGEIGQNRRTAIRVRTFLRATPQFRNAEPRSASSERAESTSGHGAIGRHLAMLVGADAAAAPPG